ncbi:hypothetical protein FHR22_002172 [Sphingopyxis panaciterrae]|nr:hypothetical protein [Sphingopyxis panaciterrae]
MNELIQIGPISPLRQRLIDDMTMRSFSKETQRIIFATSDGSRPGSGARRTPRAPRMSGSSRSSNSGRAFRRRP